MFNYHVRIIERCLVSLSDSNTAAFRRFCLLALILLCTEVPFSVRFPFENKTQENNKANEAIYSTLLSQEGNITLGLDKNKTKLIIKINSSENKGIFFGFCLFVAAALKKVSGPIRAHLNQYYERKKSGIFKEIFAKIAPMMPHGPPAHSLRNNKYDNLIRFPVFYKIFRPYVYKNIGLFFLIKGVRAGKNAVDCENNKPGLQKKEEEMRNKNSGFTLLELIIVIIIIGVLATLGFTQYTKMVEKGRASEARAVLGTLRTAEQAYFLENKVYTATIADLGVEAQTNCATGTHYFSYACDAAGTCTATRCMGAAGKQPGGDTAYTKSLTIDGTWGGDAGY